MTLPSNRARGISPATSARGVLPSQAVKTKGHNGNGLTRNVEAWQLIALELHKRGFYPIPLQSGTGIPTIKDWPKRLLTTDNVTQYFDARVGSIGVLLGIRCGSHLGVTDVDL